MKAEYEKQTYLHCGFDDYDSGVLWNYDVSCVYWVRHAIKYKIIDLYNIVKLIIKKDHSQGFEIYN